MFQNSSNSAPQQQQLLPPHIAQISLLLSAVLLLQLSGVHTSPLIATYTGMGGERCSPGELIWVDCNLCTCNLQGRPNIICARMWCQPQGGGGSSGQQDAQPPPAAAPSQEYHHTPPTPY